MPLKSNGLGRVLAKAMIGNDCVTFLLFYTLQKENITKGVDINSTSLEIVNLLKARIRVFFSVGYSVLILPKVSVNIWNNVSHSSRVLCSLLKDN